MVVVIVGCFLLLFLPLETLVDTYLKCVCFNNNNIMYLINDVKILAFSLLISSYAIISR